MTGRLHRDIPAAAAAAHDVIVIGGGIYGAFVALEAARRGLRPLLLERADFGGATSRAGLRIIHGGLRYLQSLDVRRCRQSARERAWMLREFPDLVHPLGCLVPMYGPGLRRPGAFRLAAALDQLVTAGTRAGLPPAAAVPPGRVAEIFPQVDRRGLLGGGIWHDGVIAGPERLLIEVLRWACARGAAALNYVEAIGLMTSTAGGSHGVRRVQGVTARDQVTGQITEFRAPVVINCAGPWCRDVARRLDRDVGSLFRPSLAFNLLLDVPPPSSLAVAVAPARARGKLYFLVLCHGRVMAGTVHVPCHDDTPDPEPTAAQVAAFIADLNGAVPGWNIAERDVVSVLSGLLPASEPSTAHQAERPILLDHARLAGPRGLWSLSGVKYTTARLVAQHAVQRALGRAGPPRPSSGRPDREAWLALLDPAYFTARTPVHSTAAALQRTIDDEAVVHLDDLILRRSSWGLDPAHALTAGARACELLAWDKDRTGIAMARLGSALGVPRGPARPPSPTRAARPAVLNMPGTSVELGRGA